MIGIDDIYSMTGEEEENIPYMYGYEVKLGNNNLFLAYETQREAKKQLDFLQQVSKGKYSSQEEAFASTEDDNAYFGEVFELYPDSYVPDVGAYLDIDGDPIFFVPLNYKKPIKLYVKDL